MRLGFLKNMRSLSVKKKLLYLLCLTFVVRMGLSFLPAFNYDQSAFRFWSIRLVELGPAHFFSKQVFTNNPIGFLYILWVIGLIKTNFLSHSLFFQNNQLYDLLLKLPSNIADLISALLIYLIIKEKLDERWALLGFALYAFNPAIIFESAIWGQYDSVAILFLVLSIYFCLVKKSATICSIFFSFAWITKPQSLEIAPFLIFYFLKDFKPIQWGYSILAFTLTTLIVFLPFFPNNPFYGIHYVNSGSINLFNCTTCNALNFWGIMGNWQNDMNLFLNIPFLYWGFAFLVGIFPIIFGLKKLNGNILYLTISISMLAFFMLLTRMHERYFSYFFPFLLLSAITLKSKVLIIFYIFFSFLLLLNLYIPYAYYNNSVKITNLPVNYLFNHFNNFSLFSFLGFVLLFIYYLNYVKHHSIT